MRTAADEDFDSITASLRADWGLNHLRPTKSRTLSSKQLSQERTGHPRVQ